MKQRHGTSAWLGFKQSVTLDYMLLTVFVFQGSALGAVEGYKKSL